MSINRLYIGATGLIGQCFLQENSRLNKDLAILARSTPKQRPSLEHWHCAPELRAAAPAALTGVTTVFCSLGTTRAKAGSKAAFAAIDRDLTLALAHMARAAGATHWIQVSALGANPRSLIYYNRIKGEVDSALSGLGFARVDILHPSLLLGPRSEKRPGEALGQRVMPLLNPLLQGPLRAYRATPALAVAQKMLALEGQTESGVFHHDFAAIDADSGG